MRMTIRRLLVCSLILCVSGFAQSRFEEVNETFMAETNRPFEVIVDVDAGEILIEKGDEERSAVVSAEYTSGEFRDKIRFNSQRNRLEVRVEKKKWYSHKKDDENLECRVTVLLPTGVDILFDGNINAGEADLYMGGLRIKEFSLSNWAGEIEVRFDEPNPVQMDFMDIDARVGEARLIQLGNARFEKADINGGIGRIDVDFSGDLIDNSAAHVDLDIGEANISLPGDIGVQFYIGGGFSFMSQKTIGGDYYKRGRYYYSDGYDEAEKHFHMRVTPGLGELDIHQL